LDVPAEELAGIAIREMKKFALGKMAIHLSDKVGIIRLRLCSIQGHEFPVSSRERLSEVSALSWVLAVLG
jgi:hypothetical protein